MKLNFGQINPLFASGCGKNRFASQQANAPKQQPLAQPVFGNLTQPNVTNPMQGSRLNAIA